MRRSFALFALALALLSGRADATTSRQATLGARAIAMAGAFSAVASDASAVHWNPAALATLQRQELGFGYADRFGLGLNQSYLAYSLPIADNHALGVDWFNLGFDDSELGAGQNKLNFAYGYRNGIRALKPYIGSTAIGVAGKYRSLNFDLDGNQLTSAAGWGFDLGLLAPLPFGIRLGLSVQDLGGTSLEHDGGIAEKVYGTRYRLGLAHKPIEGLTVAAGLDDALRFGAEYWVQGLLALRAGLLTELDTPESFGDATTTSFGLGVKYGFATLDYAYERHPVLPATHYTSLSLSYNPRVVAIKDATIRPNPIFRSLYQHYQENDFCDVVIANSAPEPIEVTVGIFLPKIMSVPHQETILLPPQSKEKYAFKVTFDTDIFNKKEAYFDNFVTPVIKVSYTRNRKEQSVEKQLERVYVAGKGKLSWNVPGMAAAFVTPEDLAIAGMARGLVQRYNDLLGAKFNRSNIGKAVLLFDAMGAYRIRYQADQKTPFSSVSDDKTIFDTVQYPSELLFKGEGVETKIGDCDDLTVLYASLLENLSIDTAFLEANDPGKGHIYLMFDSGISPEKAEDHFLSSAEYVVWQGRVWIPIETTMFGFTFADAWRNGVAEYKRLKVRKLIDEVYVQQWLQIYKPASLPPINVTLPASGEMDSLLFRDLDYFDQRVDQIALGSATSLDTPDGAYDAGAAYLRINHLEKALKMFDKALEMRSDHFDAINAKGVVLTHQGFYDEALELYRQSLQSADNTGVRMNIALTYYLKGERETADRLFQEVVAQDDSYLDLFDFLATVGDAQEFYDVGVSYLRQERYDLALAQFDEALAADAKFADAVNAKGVVLTHQGQYDEALALYERAAAIAPDETGYRVNISLIYYLKGDRKKADTLYQQIVSQDDAYDGLLDFLAEVGSADEHYRIAVSYMQQEEYDRALERLDQALRADPEMGDAYNTKAVILSNKGNYEEAYALLEKAEIQLPTHPGIRLNMAIVRYLQGRRHEAAVIYQQVIDMDDRYNGFLDFLLEEE
ncbi:MAG: tetratricopeptide repeat protein [Gemmatimonadetes bacterium]|nr:tetratricopeptide repeat protein [Gemmatimonadota bacterium]MBT6902675.1 tetratricopeptide repeat protein [Gemmatimonadota bacterium]MBT7421323.1 tetratricopeptide repeat protein [Gemmatimonadota bacterium]MBT7552392.1 tetratricopeptide repeat protein [Gemmatimonadota bacterium]